MKHARLLACLVPLIAAGCATSLAPSENFNDWTNSAISRYPEPRSTSAATQTATRESVFKRAPVTLTKAPAEDVHP
jgi:hypothetical protein